MEEETTLKRVLKNEDTVVIYGWMSKELGLKGNALMIYAVIYHNTKTEGDYSSGYRYLAEFTGANMSTVIGVTKKLVEAGLISKEEEKINNNDHCIIPHFRAVRRGK
jgi:DNA-binding MarR family transcriptional regulator